MLYMTNIDQIWVKAIAIFIFYLYSYQLTSLTKDMHASISYMYLPNSQVLFCESNVTRKITATFCLLFVNYFIFVYLYNIDNIYLLLHNISI